MDLVHPAFGATIAGVGGGQTIHIRQRCPAIGADFVDLDEGVVPQGFDVVGDPELQTRRVIRDGEGASQPLEGQIRNLAVDVVGARIRVEGSAWTDVMSGQIAFEMGQEVAGHQECAGATLVVRTVAAL